MRTFGRCTYALRGARSEEQDRVWLLDLEPHVRMRAKRIFGRLQKQAAGRLVLHHSAEVCHEIEWLEERYPLTMTAEDRERLKAAGRTYRETIARLETIIDPNYTPQTFALAVPARDYQARGAEVYLALGGVLIGDEVGLGKTATAICSFTVGRTLPAAVITLAHLTKQWRNQIQTFAPSLTTHILTKGTPYELPKFFGRGPDVLILSYHKLSGWADVLAAYCKSIVFDEVQEIRHPKSAKSQAAAVVAGALPYRLGLSATPIYNYGGEIYHVLNTLRPGALGTKSEFEAEWCGMGGVLKDARAFGAWAREQFFIVRHTRKEVGRELPAVQRISHVIDSDTKALDAVNESAAELARIILSRAPEEFKGQRLQASEQISVLLRQATGVAKAPHVADFVRLLVEAGEKVVLCGWHRAVYDIWLDRLKDLRPAMFTGSETAQQKEVAVERFLETDEKKGAAKVLILSLRSGAGLNELQRAASVIVFGELDWSPGVHEQAIGRLNRDGQTTPVLAYFLVSEAGSDPVIAETLGIKSEQVEGIRNPDASFLEDLQVDTEHAKRLAAHFLKSRGIAAEETTA